MYKSFRVLHCSTGLLTRWMSSVIEHPSINPYWFLEIASPRLTLNSSTLSHRMLSHFTSTGDLPVLYIKLLETCHLWSFWWSFFSFKSGGIFFGVWFCLHQYVFIVNKCQVVVINFVGDWTYLKENLLLYVMAYKALSYYCVQKEEFVWQKLNNDRNLGQKMKGKKTN